MAGAMQTDFWDHIFREHLDLTGLRCVPTSYRGHGGPTRWLAGSRMSGLRATCSQPPTRPGPPGPEPLGVPREAFASWPEAAPDPQRFRSILSQFIKRPVRKDLMDRYCANVARTSRAGLEGTIEMFYESIVDQVSATRGQRWFSPAMGTRS